LAGTLPTSKRKKNQYCAIFRHSLIFNLLKINIRQGGDVGGSAKKLEKELKNWRESIVSDLEAVIHPDLL